MQNVLSCKKLKLSFLCFLLLFLGFFESVCAFSLTNRNISKLSYILRSPHEDTYIKEGVDTKRHCFKKKKNELKWNNSSNNTATTRCLGLKPLKGLNEDINVVRENVEDNSIPTEKYNFKAEVNKVMDIIVNSLYTDKDVFLREIISNASDACDKKRIILENQRQQQEATQLAQSSLPNASSPTRGPDTYEDSDSGADSSQKMQHGEGTAASEETTSPDKKENDETKMLIKIKPDKEKKTLTITDNGIGMDKNELIHNLGTIAQSGTAKFLKQIEEGKADSNLIGQFGVGFYSSFLVSSKVEVFTKKHDKIYRWFSNLNGSFTINELKEYEKEYEELKSSGTKIVLHLKEECDEYLEDYKLKELIKKYSEFIKFPIEIWSEKIDYERVPDDSVSLKDGDKMKMKTVTKRYHEWEKINVQLPIWKQNEKDLTENDYFSFYKNTFKAYDDPLAYVHFNVEGQISFNSILYIPGSLPWELTKNMFDEESRGIRLYVKRVFINDKFSETIPRWLTFLRGIVDSENLPLNVGREILQKSKMLSIINKRIVIKSINMMKGLKETGGEKWNKFVNTFGKYLKIGVVEDKENQEDIASLVEFYSINSSDKKIDLDTYIENMKTDQKCIYYISGENKKTVQNSPSLEKLKALNYDVLFSLEPIDEFCLSSLTVNKYKGYDVLDVNKADLKLKKETDQNKTDTLGKLKMEYEVLCRWLHNKFSHKLHEVRISDRLIDSPALLVQGDMGLSPSMQKYMKQQATAQGMSENEMFGGQSTNQPVLEINPNHFIIKQLNHLIQIDKMNSQLSEIAEQIFDIASMQGGYTIDDTGLFAKRVIGMMERNAQSYLQNVQSQGGVMLEEPGNKVQDEKVQEDMVHEEKLQEEKEQTSVENDKTEEMTEVGEIRNSSVSSNSSEYNNSSTSNNLSASSNPSEYSNSSEYNNSSTSNNLSETTEMKTNTENATDEMKKLKESLESGNMKGNISLEQITSLEKDITRGE